MFGGAKSWADRTVKPKACKECAEVFQPITGGNLYCAFCAPVVRRRNHARSQREWRKADPTRHALTKSKHDLKQYGLTVEEYFARLKEQEGRCAICKTDDPKGRGVTRPFAVDHCHKSGKVRALLCHRCNGALGMVSDSEATLLSMIDYLREHGCE